MLRITPDLLSKMIQIVDVDDLERSSRDAWTGDTDLAGRMSDQFGTVQIPIVRDGEVVFGWEWVAAEQGDRRDGGRMTVIDVTDLDWPPEKVWALIAGMHKMPDHVVVDQQALADLLLSIQQENEAWASAAGWDSDEIAQLIADMEAAGEPYVGAGDFEPDDTEADLEDEIETELDLDLHGGLPKGALLHLSEVTLAEPTHQVENGQVWLLGRHTLVIADVLTGKAQWAPYLERHDLFVPYPGPFLALAKRASKVSMLMVQPNRYLAGNVLDKWAAVHGQPTLLNPVEG